MRTIIVGLGNPGSRYDGTRHNIGFAIVDELARRAGAPWREKPAWCAAIAEYGEGILLVKPTTFMNDSGRAVQAIAHYYDITGDNICIVYDDRDLPFGTLRWTDGVRTGAHHNGVRSVTQEYGRDLVRLRFGIDSDHLRHKQLRDFVLDRFSSTEQASLSEYIETAANELVQRYSTMQP